MNLFLDTSVVIAACASRVGASRFLFDVAHAQGWILQTSSYVLGEVGVNLDKGGGNANRDWPLLYPMLQLIPDVLSFPWSTIQVPRKDRPILFTAAASSDVLLTLDRADFTESIGKAFYSLTILTPGDFVRRERVAGRLR